LKVEKDEILTKIQQYMEKEVDDINKIQKVELINEKELLITFFDNQEKKIDDKGTDLSLISIKNFLQKQTSKSISGNDI